MKNKKWKTKNEKWKMKNEKRKTKNEKWKTKNEKWKTKIDKRKLKNGKWKKASDWSHYCDVARRRETSSNVAKLLLMVPLEHWQNSITFFGVAVIFATKIANFREPLTLTSLTTWSTHSSKRRSLRWTSSKRQIMEVIEVDHVEETKLSQPKHIPACRSVFSTNFDQNVFGT